MDKIKINYIFAAVFDKKCLDPLVPVLKNFRVKVLGTEGTVKYLKAKGISAKSVLTGFDFDGRVKSLDRAVFARILADKTKKKHLLELSSLYSSNERSESRSSSKKGSSPPFGLTQGKQGRTVLPIDAVVVDLYKPDKKGFPESMDIGGQALIRAAIKNYKNVAVAFDKKSVDDLAWELKTNKGQTNLKSREKQAVRALRFIASRGLLEVRLFGKA